MNLVKTDKAMKLGRQLGLDEHDLDIVKKNLPNKYDEQLEGVLSLYMRQSVRPSWEEVATALWDIGEKRTAQRIADEYGMAFLILYHIFTEPRPYMKTRNAFSYAVHAYT